MKILDELIASLNYDEKIKDIRLGVFQTAVHSRGCGLASTPHEPGYIHGDSPVKEAGRLIDKSTRDFVNMVKSENLFEAAIGMAAVNSLIEVDTDNIKGTIKEIPSLEELQLPFEPQLIVEYYSR